MINITQEQIMRNWGIDNSDSPLVSIKCMTYNHEKYISRTLDGFLIQETTFPFEILIHDDASTDKTTAILHEYEKKFPKIIKVIYEEINQYQFGAHHKKINEAIKGKYLAVCEGDDYWLNRKKLQKQVKYLENNPNYAACHTIALERYEKARIKLPILIGRKKQNYKQIFVYGNGIVTLTAIYRVDLYKEYLNAINENERKKWLMGDLPLWLYFAKEYKLKHLNIISGVYRVLQESASHSNDEKKIQAFRLSSYEIRKYFAKKYNDFDLLEQYEIIERLTDYWAEMDRKQFLLEYKKLKSAPWIFQKKFFIMRFYVLYLIVKTIKKGFLGNKI